MRGRVLTANTMIESQPNTVKIQQGNPREMNERDPETIGKQKDMKVKVMNIGRG